MGAEKYMRRRGGFTLVEMMVSMALVLFIMVILATAFSAGLESFRRLKAVGDMEERLRSAANIIRRDLGADHFETRRRLSDPNFWLSGAPREGFVKVFQGSPSTVEGTDGDQNPSYIATDQGLHFSSRLRGNRRESFYQASVPSGPLFTASTNFFGQGSDANFQDSANTYNSPWAELSYLLVKTGTTDNTADPNFASGTGLYSLWRTQLVAVPDNRAVNGQTSAAPQPGQGPVPASSLSSYGQVSAITDPGGSGNIHFNSPSDLTNPSYRAWVWNQTNPPASVGAGSTLLLTDVISFQVQILRPGDTDFVDVPGDQNGQFIFDTGATPAPSYQILAIQITIRIWDTKTLQARQITIVQDM